MSNRPKHDFKPGDYVVCVDIEQQATPYLKLNKIYKIAHNDLFPDQYVNVEGDPRKGPFFVYRFIHLKDSAPSPFLKALYNIETIP